MGKTWRGLAVLLLLLLAWPASSVSAHANLDHSIPSPGAELEQSPLEVVLDFSEAIDASFSTIQLADSGNNSIVKGPAIFPPGSPAEMRLALPRLPNGIYTAVWKARSAQDGHVTQGSVSFSVGAYSKLSQVASTLPPPGEAQPATALPPLLDTLLKWLAYLGSAGAVGGYLFGLAVWRPAYHRAGGFSVGQDSLALKLIRQQVVIAAIGVGGASLAWLIIIPIEFSGGVNFSVLFTYLGTVSGLTSVARLVLMAAAAIWSRQLRQPGEGLAWRWWVGAAISSLGLLTFSLSSHAAASGSILAVGMDWLHLLALSAWVGGLPPLIRFLRQAENTSRLVPYFSRMALLSVDGIAATGLYAMLRGANSLPALVGTTYGVALLVKIGLFFVLVVMGAVNLLVLSPRLSLAEGRGAIWLKRTVRSETLIALIILGAAGVLTGVAPANQALQSQQKIGIVNSAQINGVSLTFIVSPGAVGDNEFGLDVLDRRGKPAADEIHLRFTQLDHPMGATQVTLTLAKMSGAVGMEGMSNGSMRYTIRGSYLSMIGHWQVDAIVRQPGQNDVTQSFFLNLGSGVSTSPPRPNPVAADAASVAKGKALFQQKCVPCHGPQGKGDGPIGRTLNPPPADLSLHAVPGVHTDADLFGWITNGYSGSAMPAFDRSLTDIQRWDLVNFMRTLAK